MITPDDPRHGTYAGGRLHREAGQDTCDACSYAEARYERARQLDILNGRPRTLPVAGTQRRLQALVALGHTFVRIAEALDMTSSGAHHLATKDRAYVRATTAAKVDALFEAWSMTLPPSATTREAKANKYALTVAAKRDWAPPLAWEGINIDDPDARPDIGTHTPRDRDDVDEALVERILDGDLSLAGQATVRERHIIVAAWTRRTGRPTNDLARVTGWKPERYLEASALQDDAA